jgi:Protein of unknown function (DUF2783)
MRELDTGRNRFADPDSVYRMLVEAHRGLSDEESAALNTRLVLVLANQIGDETLLRAALKLAKFAAKSET